MWSSTFNGYRDALRMASLALAAIDNDKGGGKEVVVVVVVVDEE